MRHAGFIFVLVAMLAVTVHGRPSRALQQSIDLSKIDLSKLPTLPALGLMPAGVELPPLSEFLPPLESINLPPLNDFLKSVGLPSWEEMNLPPLTEFMKPVFDPQAVELPSLQDVLQQANATFVATLEEILKGVPLPPGVKMPQLKLPPLPENLDISKLNLPPLDTSKLPKMPSLDKLITGLNALQSGDVAQLAKLANITLPANLPPLEEVTKAIQPLAQFLSKVPNMDLSKIDVGALLSGSSKIDVNALAQVLKALPPMPDNMPPLDDILKTVVSLASKAAPAASSGRHLLQVQ